MSAPRLSVVICTFNRLAFLQRALKTLTEQTLARGDYEVLVVDNASTDGTAQWAEAFCQETEGFRYVLEKKKGLSHARNAGWGQAQANYIAYADDDCELPPEWLAIADGVLKEKAPAILGGPYYPGYLQTKPKWFRDEYCAHIQGDRARELGDQEYLHGCNIIFRRSVLEKLGGFDPDLGMTGHTIAYGEETALQKNLRKDYPQEVIYYEPRLFVYHVVRPEKMRLWWIVMSRFQAGRYSVLDFGDNKPRLKKNWRRGWALVWSGWQVLVEGLKAWVGRDRALYPYWQNYFCGPTMKRVEEFGVKVELWRQGD